VLRRVLPAVLAALAAYADGRGSHGLAFDALLGAIPFAAVAALESFGAYLDRRHGGAHSLLWALALGLLVLSCAARSPAAETHTLPALGSSALTACLVIFGLKAVLAVAPQLRRLALMRPAKP
jgi:cyanate permease